MKLSLEQMNELLKTADNSNELVLLGQSIGAEALKTVMDVLGGSGGCETYIPTAENFFRKLGNKIRDKDIYDSWHKGKTREFADKYNIKPTRVLQIVKEQSELEEQNG